MVDAFVRLGQVAPMKQFLLNFGIELAQLRKGAVQVALIWLLAWLVWQLVRLVARRIVVAASDGDDTTFTIQEKRAATVAQLLRSVGRVVVLVMAVLLTLNQFINITALLAGAGVLGLAISFGAQSLVKDIIAGFFILMENQFTVGDVIEVSGKSGTVERMTLRMVMLRDLEGAVHIVPNGQIVTVTNRTRGWARAVLDIGVGYESDVDEALAILRNEVLAFAAEDAWAPRLDGTPEVLGVERLGESSVTIRVLLRTQPGKQWEVGREFLRRAKVRLDHEGIEVPMPQRTVHLRHHGRTAPDQEADNAAAAGGA